jgi:D-xylose 1-dehydrogenase (NADP+, D-xylono-1,5-lactone-forming)
MRKVRWGLLSTANINRRLIPAIRVSRRGELVAVASRDGARCKAYARKWNIPQSFDSYQAMLDSGRVDAVYISLPNHLHAEWSIRAMQAGVHVLCEKPFALSLEQADQMIAASQQTGRVLAEALMYLHHPQTKIMGEWAHSGRLGEISLVHGAFNFTVKTRDNVRLVDEYGGGCLWDVGIYPLSFAQYILGGPPTAVSGMQWVGDTGIDETFAGQLIYPGDRLAQISASFRTPYYTYVEIIGTQGRMTLNQPFTRLDDDRRLIFYPQEGDPREVPIPEQDLYIGEVEDMHAAILDGAQTYLGLSETRDRVRTILALYESARSGKTVQL